MYQIGAGELFTLFFITLGPLKMLGSFARQTSALDVPTLRKFSVVAFVMGLVSAIVFGWIGASLAVKWNISVPAMLLAMAVIFFLVALRLVMEQYDAPPPHPPEPLPAKPLAAALRLTFPAMLSPYGMAALITMLVNSHAAARTEVIFAALAGVMVLNLLCMLFIRQIMHGVMLFILQILGAVLGVLQIGLAIQIAITALQQLNVIRT